jgi:hypothetical protein
MKLRSLALFLAVALASAAANAQTGVYLAFDAQQFDQKGILPGNLITRTERQWSLGPEYGIYYNITHIPKVGTLHTGPVRIGLDAHGDIFRDNEQGSQLDREDGVFGLRISSKNKIKTVTPYFRGGFGIGHTRVPFAAHYSNNFVYQFGIGVDRNIHGKFDWRIMEADAGFLGGYYVGAGAQQSNYLVTLSTGITFRIFH